MPGDKQAVHHHVAHDVSGNMGAVLVHVAAKVGQRGVRTGHQHLGNVVQRGAQLGKKLVL